MANEYGWAPMPQNQQPQGGQMQYPPVMQQPAGGYQAPMGSQTPMSGSAPMPDRLEQWRNRQPTQPMQYPGQQFPMQVQYQQPTANPQTPGGQEPPNGWVGLNWVVSEAEAQMYPVAAGNTVVMLEVDREIAYIKSVSREGRPGFWAYHMVPVKPKAENEYVTREEYNNLLAENNRMLAMIQQLTERSTYEQSTTGAGRKPDEQPHAAEHHAVRPEFSGEPEGGGYAADQFGPDHAGADQPVYGDRPAG